MSKWIWLPCHFFGSRSSQLLGGDRWCAGALTRPSTRHLLPMKIEKTVIKKRGGIFTVIMRGGHNYGNDCTWTCGAEETGAIDWWSGPEIVVQAGTLWYRCESTWWWVVWTRDQGVGVEPGTLVPGTNARTWTWETGGTSGWSGPSSWRCHPYGVNNMLHRQSVTICNR